VLDQPSTKLAKKRKKKRKFPQSFIEGNKSSSSSRGECEKDETRICTNYLIDKKRSYSYEWPQ